MSVRTATMRETERNSLVILLSESLLTLPSVKPIFSTHLKGVYLSMLERERRYIRTKCCY